MVLLRGERKLQEWIVRVCSFNVLQKELWPRKGWTQDVYVGGGRRWLMVCFRTWHICLRVCSYKVTTATSVGCGYFMIPLSNLTKERVLSSLVTEFMDRSQIGNISQSSWVHSWRVHTETKKCDLNVYFSSKRSFFFHSTNVTSSGPISAIRFVSPKDHYHLHYSSLRASTQARCCLHWALFHVFVQLFV